MRISDWSSDVCSSDLADRADLAVAAQRRARGADRRLDVAHARILVELAHQPQRTLEFGADIGIEFDRWLERSEEHTSELQSLMRISYAVFCLKKKITYIIKTIQHT